MKIHEYLRQPMDRRTFLKHMAVAVLAVGGALNILKYFKEHDIPWVGNNPSRQRLGNRRVAIDKTNYPKQTAGYGSSKYGA